MDLFGVSRIIDKKIGRSEVKKKAVSVARSQGGIRMVKDEK